MDKGEKEKGRELLSLGWVVCPQKFSSSQYQEKRGNAITFRKKRIRGRG